MTHPIYVIGHKNPDTDSVCSALAYANLKQVLGELAVPCKAGEINPETRFVLEYFAVPEPELLEDLRARVKDLIEGEIPVVGPEVSLIEAWRLMRSKGEKTLPVVDKGNRLIGLVTGGDLAERYFSDLGELSLEDASLVLQNVVNSQNTPVGSIAGNRNLVVFEDDDLLADVRKVMLETRYRNYPVVDEQYQVVGLIARYHLLGFSKKKVILVDHNELSHAVEGMEDAQILEVVDHHRVGGIQTVEPILFRNEPVGATCTLVAKAYFEAGVLPSRELAGIMCGAILSDTMVFKSPTCTFVDRDMAQRLGYIAGIDPVEFGAEMFRRTSSLGVRTPKEMLRTDYKEFAVSDLRLGIGQVNVMGTQEISALKPAILEEMDSVRQGEGLDYVLLMVTDLLAEGTVLLICGPNQEYIGGAFDVKVEENQVYLPGVLSRKKQVVPPLTKHFNQLNG